MNALQKIKLSKERASLIASLKASELKAFAKVKASKRVAEIVTLLGGTANSEPTATDANPLYQSILDGAELTVDLIERTIEEAQKDLNHWQLRDAVRTLVRGVDSLMV